jgi:rSAM/selenodomain-associated transferase 2
MEQPGATATMQLSIIMPVLNEAAQIQQMLSNLASLRARGAQIVVVDGGSNDATVALAAPLADQCIQTGRGRARQMNAGAQAASGAVLLFLHADTVLPDGADKLVVDGLQQSGRAWGRFNVNISGQHRMLRVVANLMNIRSRLTGIATGDQTIFVRRTDFDAVGGFPEQALMEDIEISSRLKRRSRPLCLQQRVTTSGRRWESRGVWPTIRLMWRLRLLYWMGVSADNIAKAYR